MYRHPKRGIYIDAPGRTLFEWVENLEDALAPFPHVKIVLSTSWVRALGYSRTVKRLPLSLRLRTVGATFHSVHHNYTRYLGPYASNPRLRGEEVVTDVGRRCPTSWVAVDDTDEGWPDSAREHLVLCNWATGLGDADTLQRLRTAFAKHFTLP